VHPPKAKAQEEAKAKAARSAEDQCEHGGKQPPQGKGRQGEREQNAEGEPEHRRLAIQKSHENGQGRARIRPVRIAVFSDVHANLPALTAVLEFVERLPLDRVLCLGDVVGYGPHPREVIALLKEKNIPCTLGGSDVRAIFPTPGRARSAETEAALRWTRAQLGEAERAFLRSLPPMIRLNTPVGRAKAFHGRPDDPEARFPLYAPEPELLELLAPLRAPVVLAGGSHVPVFRKLPGYYLLDPGSVGLTLGGEPGADLAVLTIKEDDVAARFYKLPYDFGQTAFDIQAWGLPERIAEVIRTGRPLEPEG